LVFRFTYLYAMIKSDEQEIEIIVIHLIEMCGYDWFKSRHVV